MEFNLYNLLLIIGFGQGAFLTISIPSVTNNRSNNVLRILIMLATVMLSGRIFVYERHSELAIKVSTFIDTSIFLFGPLTYYYFKRRFDNVNHDIKFIHFLPTIVHLIYSFVIAWLSLDFIIGLLSTRWFNMWLISIELMGLISFLSYWASCWKFYIKLDIQSKHVEVQKEQRVYFVSVMMALGILLSSWLIGFISLYFFRDFSAVKTYNIIWIMTSIFFYIVGFYNLRKSNIFKIPNKENGRIGLQSVQNHKAKLIQLISEEKIYLDPELTLKDLAERLNTSSNNTSWLLNNVYQKTFYEYINEARVEAFKGKLDSDDHKNFTLLALAHEVGFKSKSTFNKSFKSSTGLTPSQYARKKTS